MRSARNASATAASQAQFAGLVAQRGSPRHNVTVALLSQGNPAAKPVPVRKLDCPAISCALRWVTEDEIAYTGPRGERGGRSESMLHPRAVCFSLALLVTVASNALAQGSPGYRMRFPAGGILGPRPGSVVRPPRLTVPSPGNSAEGFRRQFFSPYQYFGAYPFGSYGYEDPEHSSGDYSADSMPVRDVDPADYSTEVKPARNVQTLDDSAAVGKLQVTRDTSGTQNVVRLTWRDEGAGVSQVAFFLARADSTTLSAQTVRSPPFTAVFEPFAATAFAGMTVVLPGGTLVTQYVRYGRERREGREGR